MAKALHLDLETYSACELKDRGLHNYANDDSTGVHCAAYAFDDGAVELWTPAAPPPLDVFEHIRSGGLVYAHNAFFEISLVNCVLAPSHDWPRLSIEQMRCTMAMCYAMGIPGALENAAPALGIAQRKDQSGKRVMLQLAKPKADGTFWKYEDDPVKFQQLFAYCIQDTEVERALHHRMMELSDYEQKVWQLDFKINQRGVRVDLPAIDKAIALVEVEKKRLNAEMLRVTGGVVGACTEVQLLVKWIRSQGVEMTGLAKADVLDALEGDLPPAVEAALHLRREAAKSSTAKLVAMKERASSDGRVRGIHQYHGAATGRWAGRGIQTQNFPRGNLRPHEVEDAIDHLHDRDYLDVMYGQPMDVLASCLRGMIVPTPGKDLVAADFSAIEARVLAWLAGQESVLQIFQTHGKIYEHAAAGIYHVPMESVTKAQRQIGKVAVLALGYGGGVGAFQSMARVYGVKVPDAEADEIKSAWRAANEATVSYWYRLEDAAIAAITRGGKHSAGAKGRECTYVKSGSFLWCRLPSGRVLCYPYPEIRLVETPWGAQKEALTYMTVVDPSRKLKLLPDPNSKGSWQRISTYGGSLAENVTQAVAADLLRHSMFALEAGGFPIVMHIHDEAVVEIATACEDDTLEQIEKLMAATPIWASGLPVAAEGFRAARYRK
ncbi:MAG TPA: DNA polymerase [Rhizobacter sp.]|jgi:DNA polymerase|nr:DNA polymerase [Rhizobacter sp.]